MQLQLGVIDGSREIGDELPLVELLGAVQPVGLPQAQLRLGDAAHLAGGGALHAAEEDILRLLPVSVLRQRQPRARHLAIAPLAPQTHEHVLFAEETVQLRQRVETPRLLGIAHHVVLEQRDCDVPRVVRLAQKLDELARNLRLRLTERDAFQQRLHHVGAHSRLPLMILL